MRACHPRIHRFLDAIYHPLQKQDVSLFMENHCSILIPRHISLSFPIPFSLYFPEHGLKMETESKQSKVRYMLSGSRYENVPCKRHNADVSLSYNLFKNFTT